jgi:O-acetyl-ADP-ribose deacetylase (regulator of RNase III)
MDGGIDLLYTRHFGLQVQERLQALIRDRHLGELLVGAAEIVETDDPQIPFLIAAPTMRVPMILSKIVNPYLATRAALLLIEHGKFADGSKRGTAVRQEVETVAFPGIGTGVGQVSPEICARQVRAAIEEVVFRQRAFPRSWSEAQEQHQLLYTSVTRDLQYDGRKETIERLVDRAERYRRRLSRFRSRLRNRYQL